VIALHVLFFKKHTIQRIWKKSIHFNCVFSVIPTKNSIILDTFFWSMLQWCGNVVTYSYLLKVNQVFKVQSEFCKKRSKFCI